MLRAPGQQLEFSLFKTYMTKEKEKLREELKLLKEQLKSMKERSTVEFAQGLIDKLFSRFKKASEWLIWTKAHTKKHYYTYSPIGMRRNLFGVMTGIPSIVGAMERRAANSPIQGFASQIGVVAARLVTLNMYKILKKFEYIDDDTTDLPVDIVKAVHDALYAEPKYEVILIFVHVLQWTATYGVTEYYKKHFGVEFTVEPEIEIEIGASEDKHYKWDFSDNQLKELLKKSLEDQLALRRMEGTVEDNYNKIMSVYKNSSLKEYLDTRYPILGVK